MTDETETFGRAITHSETFGSSHLWFGIGAGPIAWSVQLGMNWYLAEVVACAPITHPQGTVAGLPLAPLIAIANALLLAVTVGGGIVAYRCLRLHHDQGDPTTGRRATWMARSGIINSVLFGGSIIVSYVPLVMLTGCQS